MEKMIAEFNKGSAEILENIEKQEYQRLETMRVALTSFSASIQSLVQQHESLHKLIDIEFSNVDASKDILSFIQKNSTFAENERLRTLYKELGLYTPLSDDTHPSHDRLRGAGLVVEKTSRAMA